MTTQRKIIASKVLAQSKNADSETILNISDTELKLLFKREPDPEAGTSRMLTLVTAFLTPITLWGMLEGFKRGYKRFMYPKDVLPQIHLSPPVVRLSMIIGGIVAWLVLIGALIAGLCLLYALVPAGAFTEGMIFVVLGYMAINLIIGFVIRSGFRNWQIGFNNAIIDGRKFGSARFARPEELREMVGNNGFYIGGGYTFNDKGHILTVAGTRGGKGTNLIIPNLLGVGGYEGSWVVIDPKGENAAITARYQRERGQNVVILNPWGLLAEHVGPAVSYNPLDILADKTNINLVDDAQMIAEMIVPIEKNAGGDKFFTDTARAVISGLLLHMAVSQEQKNCTLKTLWKWVRLPADDFDKLLEDMVGSNDKIFGEVIMQCGNEIEKLMDSGEDTWGSILATVLQCTEFIKSPALQKAMITGFDPKKLADGKTTMYVIIPADKLQSHARWLRLVVTTTMRAVVRAPKERVCWLLDEFAALGYLPEIETALSTYAGYNMTVWPILQSLVQLQSNYHDNWETFIGNSTIRQYFSVNDNFTAEYVSQAIGSTSHVVTNTAKNNKDVEGSQSNQRALVTPDELRRASGHLMFVFIKSKPVTYYDKLPYYEMGELTENNGKKWYDDNPYFKK